MVVVVLQLLYGLLYTFELSYSYELSRVRVPPYWTFVHIGRGIEGGIFGVTTRKVPMAEYSAINKVLGQYIHL